MHHSKDWFPTCFFLPLHACDIYGIHAITAYELLGAIEWIHEKTKLASARIARISLFGDYRDLRVDLGKSLLDNVVRPKVC